MSYSLAGNIPNPIPMDNTDAARVAQVGVVHGTGMPWLETNLTVRNVSSGQAQAAVDLVRSTLSSSGAVVADVRWVAGGTIYSRWKPSRPAQGVEYAEQMRAALLQAAQRLGANAAILMDRFVIDMPVGQDNLYVYPPAETTMASTMWATPAMGVAALVALGLAGAAVYVSRSQVRRNRRRRSR